MSIRRSWFVSFPTVSLSYWLTIAPRCRPPTTLNEWVVSASSLPSNRRTAPPTWAMPRLDSDPSVSRERTHGGH
jgi:hypothetical protein